MKKLGDSLTRQIQFHIVLSSILIFSAFAYTGRASSMTAHQSSGSELSLSRSSLAGNPAFDPGEMPADMQLWYDRLWGAINNPNIYPNPTGVAMSGDLYGMGRTLHSHVMALIAAFRATGDLQLVAEIDRLMETLFVTNR